MEEMHHVRSPLALILSHESRRFVQVEPMDCGRPRRPLSSPNSFISFVDTPSVLCDLWSSDLWRSDVCGMLDSWTNRTPVGRSPILQSHIDFERFGWDATACFVATMLAAFGRSLILP